MKKMISVLTAALLLTALTASAFAVELTPCDSLLERAGHTDISQYIDETTGTVDVNRLIAESNANHSAGIQLDSNLNRLHSSAEDRLKLAEENGLKISERMRGQIKGLDQASTNAQDGISMVQTAEGALNETTAILQRMKELAVQAANDTVEDEPNHRQEIAELQAEIERISQQSEFQSEAVPQF